MMLPRRALAVLILCSALAGCHRKPAQLGEHAFRLGNGLQVDLIDGPCGEGAEVVVLYAVGSDHDPAGRSGLVHVLARAADVEDAADHVLAARAVTSDQLAGAIDEAAARMGRLGLVPSDGERARAAVMAEVARRRGGDAALTAITYAAESVQPTRGDGRRGGVAAEVEAISPGELDAFWQAYMKPANARLIIVGRFDPAAIRARIEAAFASVPAGAPPVLRAPVEATVTGTLVMGDAPAMVAVAVPAPAPSSSLFPAFLILAARPAGGGLQLTYDPLASPATLFATGAVRPGESPEAAATRVRAEVAAVLGRPLARADVAAARERFAALLGTGGLDAAACGRDRRGFAIGRARRAQLGLDGAALTRALDAVTAEQLAAAAALFDAKRTAAVVAGGAIR
jgi:Peptidase M16 inactive domain